jgi:hypothetical protein
MAIGHGALNSIRMDSIRRASMSGLIMNIGYVPGLAGEKGTCRLVMNEINRSFLFETSPSGAISICENALVIYTYLHFE